MVAWFGRKAHVDHGLDQVPLQSFTGPLVTQPTQLGHSFIADCDVKLATHRAALEAGADPILVTQWITETQARRARAEADFRTASKGHGARMSHDEIARLVRSISDLAAVIQQAEAEDKTEIYRVLGSGSPTLPRKRPCAPRSRWTRKTTNPHGR